jgi:4-hydroxy-tetrahydrodipicolinate synthase
MTFSGSIVALVTPFKKGKVDYAGLERLIQIHLEKGTDGIVPCGTTGEASTLSFVEHKEVLRFVVKEVARRIPVICGCGSNNTIEALDLVQYSKKIKADGVLVVTPYYNRPTQEGLYRHYRFLTTKVAIPLVLYNVPGRTGVNLLPDTVARLSEFKNIVAIKEASGSVDQSSEIIRKCALTVISGDDSLTLPLLSVGAKGVISVSANVIPDKVSALVHSFLNGDAEKAQKIHNEIFNLNKNLFIETNPVPVKTALKMMRWIATSEVRLPLCEMKRENEAVLRRTLQELRLVK